MRKVLHKSGQIALKYFSKIIVQEIRIAKVVEFSGANCMSPVIVARAIREVQVGEVIEVRTNDACARDDLKIWAKNTGNEILSIEDIGNGWFRILIRRAK